MGIEDIRNIKAGGGKLKPKKYYSIPKVGKKKQKLLDEQKKEMGDTEKVKWFKNRIKQMTGYCAETGLKTETRIYAYAIMSICHLLPQENCESVKFHPLNWIELNCDFHTKFDAMSWEEREQLGCWPIIEERLIHVWECLDPSERRFFPNKLRLKIESNNFG